MELTNLSKSSSGNHDSSDGCEMCWCYRFLSLAMQGKRLFVCPCVLGSEDILVRRKVRSGSRSGLTTQGGEASVCPLLQRPAFVKSVLGLFRLASISSFLPQANETQRIGGRSKQCIDRSRKHHLARPLRCVANCTGVLQHYYSQTTKLPIVIYPSNIYSTQPKLH